MATTDGHDLSSTVREEQMGEQGTSTCNRHMKNTKTGHSLVLVAVVADDDWVSMQGFPPLTSNTIGDAHGCAPSLGCPATQASGGVARIRSGAHHAPELFCITPYDALDLKLLGREFPLAAR